MTDELMSEIKAPRTNGSIITVVGVGGAGGNAVNHMWNLGIRGVTFMVCNTDQQALDKSPVERKIRLGSEGLGAGNDPEIGRRAAVESLPEIRQVLEEAGTKMLFITAGMGGGTGTGCAPVVAEIAREQGALTIAVVTKPFAFEGKQRMRNAEAGISDLKQRVDTLVVIPNDRLLQVVSKGTSMVEAFGIADEVLHQGIQGISDLIAVPALINLDFADVKTVMESGGMAHMGIGYGEGENKMIDAAKNAISSPMLETSISGARAVLINITGGKDISIIDINEAANLVMEEADPDANIIFGAGIDESMGDKVRITVIATGFEKTPFPPREPVKSARDINRDRLYGSNYGATGATGATGSYTPGNYGATGGYTPSYTSSDSYNSHPTMGVPQAPMTQQPAQPAYYAPQQPAQPQQPAYGQPQLFGNQPQQLDYAQQGYTGNMQPVQQQYAGGATGPMPSVQPQQPKRPTTDANGVPSFMKRRGN